MSGLYLCHSSCNCKITYNNGHIRKQHVACITSEAKVTSRGQILPWNIWFWAWVKLWDKSGKMGHRCHMDSWLVFMCCLANTACCLYIVGGFLCHCIFCDVTICFVIYNVQLYSRFWWIFYQENMQILFYLFLAIVH